MAYDYDLIVLGVGPAGEKGAVQAAYFDKRVAVIERAEAPGGAAVHTGTLPSKTLRETAIYLSGFRQRELYGLSVDINPDAAVPKLLSRKNAVRGLEVERIRWNLERHGVTYINGEARFIDAHTVEIRSPNGGTRQLTSPTTVIPARSPTKAPTARARGIIDSRKTPRIEP